MKKSKNKNNTGIKVETPKNVLSEKAIIDKFAPGNKQSDKPINKIEVLKDAFLDDKEFLEYMDNILKESIKEKARSKGKQMEEVFKTLDHIMPEFYQTCMIFGFNALGEKTIYMYAPTEKDRDALFHHVKSTVFSLGEHQ
jgi:hypothetical protein